MREKGKQEYLLWSQLLIQQRRSTAMHSNLHPGEGGWGLEEGLPFLSQGWEAPCSVGSERASPRLLDHMHPSCSLPSPLGSAYSLLCSLSTRHGHLGCPGSLFSLPASS